MLRYKVITCLPQAIDLNSIETKKIGKIQLANFLFTYSINLIKAETFDHTWSKHSVSEMDLLMVFISLKKVNLNFFFRIFLLFLLGNSGTLISRDGARVICWLWVLLDMPASFLEVFEDECIFRRKRPQPGPMRWLSGRKVFAAKTDERSSVPGSLW